MEKFAVIIFVLGLGKHKIHSQVSAILLNTVLNFELFYKLTNHPLQYSNSRK